MNKKLLSTILVSLILVNSYATAQAKNNYYNARIKVAIKKYKIGNYTGCIQDCQNITKTDPSNPFAYYYLAMAYVQAGKKKEAIKNYAKVISLNTDPKLKEYATTGKRCIETPDKCELPKPKTAVKKEKLSDIDKFVASPSNASFSGPVRKDIEQKYLNEIKNNINNDRPLDESHLQRLNDASDSIDGKKLSAKPSEDEVKKALKVLSDAGYSGMQTQPDAQSNINTQMMNYQNPELMELNALMGNGNQSNNNSMMNMMPYMLSQNKDGSRNYSPELMQSYILNSMMSNMNYNIDVDKDKDK